MALSKQNLLPLSKPQPFGALLGELTMSKQDTIEAAALELLFCVMEEGAEFPDEAWRLSQKYKVPQADIEQAYDDLTN
jgi:hypothetical protein